MLTITGCAYTTYTIPFILQSFSQREDRLSCQDKLRSEVRNSKNVEIDKTTMLDKTLLKDSLHSKEELTKKKVGEKTGKLGECLDLITLEKRFRLSFSLRTLLKQSQS